MAPSATSQSARPRLAVRDEGRAASVRCSRSMRSDTRAGSNLSRLLLFATCDSYASRVNAGIDTSPRLAKVAILRFGDWSALRVRPQLHRDVCGHDRRWGANQLR